MMPLRFFLFVSVLLLFGCKASKKGIIKVDRQLLLEAQVQRLINCLNEKDANCLIQLYSDEFRSISPIMEISSKSELIARTIKGFDTNQYTAEASVEEVRVGQEMGYVVMEYRLYEPGEDNSYSLLLQKKRIDIWHYNMEVGWQLFRSAFYDPQLF